MTKPLFKTTIVIWSDFHQDAFPMDISVLGREAEIGEAYCSMMETRKILDPEVDKDWDGTEFFDED